MFSDAKALESCHGRLPPSACIYKFASEAAGICWNLLALFIIFPGFELMLLYVVTVQPGDLHGFIPNSIRYVICRERHVWLIPVSKLFVWFSLLLLIFPVNWSGPGFLDIFWYRPGIVSCLVHQLAKQAETVAMWSSKIFPNLSMPLHKEVNIQHVRAADFRKEAKKSKETASDSAP